MKCGTFVSWLVPDLPEQASWGGKPPPDLLHELVLNFTGGDDLSKGVKSLQKAIFVSCEIIAGKEIGAEDQPPRFSPDHCLCTELLLFTGMFGQSMLSHIVSER